MAIFSYSYFTPMICIGASRLISTAWSIHQKTMNRTSPKPNTQRTQHHNAGTSLKKTTEKNQKEETNTTAGSKKDERLKIDAQKTPKSPRTEKHQTERAPKTTIPSENPISPRKNRKNSKNNSSTDTVGKKEARKERPSDTLKAWAENYKSTENCSSKTRATIDDIVRAVEKASNSGQIAVDLAEHASAFSALSTTRQKALRRALKNLNTTGLPEPQKKTASPRPIRAKKDSNTGLEKKATTEAQNLLPNDIISPVIPPSNTDLPEVREEKVDSPSPLTKIDPDTGIEGTAATKAQSTLQLSWDTLEGKFDNWLGDYFNDALKANNTRNFEEHLNKFLQAFLELQKTTNIPAVDFLDGYLCAMDSCMKQMLSHIHNRLDSELQKHPRDLAGMKSLLIKLQGNENMPSMRDAWANFARALNETLPDRVSKLDVSLPHFDQLEKTIPDEPKIQPHLSIEKKSKAALPYNQETASAAYNQEYLKFRLSTTHQKLMDSANNDLTPYVQSFKIITTDDSGLSEEKAQQMVLQRSLVDYVSGTERQKTDPETNRAILGCERSYFDEHPEQSPQDVAFIMDTPMHLTDGSIKKVTVLTVSAPALDSKSNPVWDDFVDGNGKLKKDVYARHYRSLCTLIRQASDQNPDKRVVISAVGMGAFLEALSDDQQAVARDIAAEQLAQLAIELRTQGRTVAYADIREVTENSKKIQGSLSSKGADQLTFVGKLTDTWTNENDLYINAGDPHSCAGNGGKLDNSVEGYLGRNSLMSDIHVQVAINAQLAKNAQQ